MRVGKWIGSILLFVTAPAMAQSSVERWECRDYLGSSWNDILVRATVDSGRASGTIEVAGVTWYTAFEVEGFNRRWNFGPKDHSTRYAFVIAPDGISRYYDFASESHKTKADAVMECRKRGG